MKDAWGFYGRDDELAQLRSIVARGRWFFVRITGRRRIGKTALLQRGLGAIPRISTRLFATRSPARRFAPKTSVTSPDGSPSDDPIADDLPRREAAPHRPCPSVPPSTSP